MVLTRIYKRGGGREREKRQRERGERESNMGLVQTAAHLSMGEACLTLRGLAGLYCSLIGGQTGPRLGLHGNLVHILQHIRKCPLIQNLHNKPTNAGICGSKL